MPARSRKKVGKPAPKVEKSPLPSDELVDEASRESFPASDPPAWTAGVHRDERKKKG